MGSTETDNRQKVPAKRLIELIRENDNPVMTAGDLAEHLPITRQAVNSRLQRLVTAGELERKKVGGSAVVYWVAED